jgi:hypothetical protein
MRPALPPPSAVALAEGRSARLEQAHQRMAPSKLPFVPDARRTGRSLRYSRRPRSFAPRGPGETSTSSLSLGRRRPVDGAEEASLAVEFSLRSTRSREISKGRHSDSAHSPETGSAAVSRLDPSQGSRPKDQGVVGDGGYCPGYRVLRNGVASPRAERDSGNNRDQRDPESDGHPLRSSFDPLGSQADARKMPMSIPTLQRQEVPGAGRPLDGHRDALGTLADSRSINHGGPPW